MDKLLHPQFLILYSLPQLHSVSYDNLRSERTFVQSQRTTLAIYSYTFSSPPPPPKNKTKKIPNPPKSNGPYFTHSTFQTACLLHPDFNFIAAKTQHSEEGTHLSLPYKKVHYFSTRKIFFWQSCKPKPNQDLPK